MLSLRLCLVWKVLSCLFSNDSACFSLLNFSQDNPLFNSGKGAVFNVAGKVRHPSLWPIRIKLT